MSWVSKHVARVTFTMKDEAAPTEHVLYVGEVTGALPAPTDLATPMQTYGSNLALVSDCKLLRFEISYIYIQTAPGAFGPAPDRERKGVLSYNTASGFPTKTSIPGIKYDAISPDGINLIRDPADDQSFTTNPLEDPLNAINSTLINGVTVGLVTFPVVDRRASDIITLEAAYKIHTSNPKG